MQDIKAWIIGICFASVACTVLEMILPEGKMKKTGKYVLSIFLLCAMFVPLTKLNITLPSSQGVPDSVSQTASQLENATKEQVFALAQKNLESEMTEELEMMGIHLVRIDIALQQKKDDIYVQQVKLWISQDSYDKGQQAVETLHKLLNVDQSAVTLYQAYN